MGRWLRSLLQRILLKAASVMEPPAWDGIYASHAEVPATGQGFGSETWARESERSLARLRALNSGFLPKEMPSEHLLLPFLLSLLARTQPTVRVVDFGGGYGLFYEQLKKTMTDVGRIEYHILEQASVCERAAKQWKDSSRLFFHSDMPTLPRPIDVLFFSSSLQYIEDYQSLLSQLVAEYQPNYLLMVKLSAGDIPTYVSAQHNLSGSVMPYWFINAQELITYVQSLHYSLLYKSVLDKTYPQRNFPTSHRMQHAANLMFVRSA